MHTRTSEIVEELYHSLTFLGARSDFLSIIGSWGDTLPDDLVLSHLRNWNAAKVRELKQCISNFETAPRRQQHNPDDGRRTA